MIDNSRHALGEAGGLQNALTLQRGPDRVLENVPVPREDAQPLGPTRRYVPQGRVLAHHPRHRAVLAHGGEQGRGGADPPQGLFQRKGRAGLSHQFGQLALFSQNPADPDCRLLGCAQLTVIARRRLLSRQFPVSGFRGDNPHERGCGSFVPQDRQRGLCHLRVPCDHLAVPALQMRHKEAGGPCDQGGGELIYQLDRDRGGGGGIERCRRRRPGLVRGHDARPFGQQRPDEIGTIRPA